MKNKFQRYISYTAVIIMLIWHAVLSAQQQQPQRFPRPEFEGGYVFPERQYPDQRGPIWEYVDVAVLVIALSITSWMVIKKRSRKGILLMSVFSLAYFGFYRQGCICAIGSVQNISLALFSKDYAIPLSVLMFFMVPLLFALLFGRVFCASVCPMGAIQELTGFRQVRVPVWLNSTLSAIPFVYLGLAVLFSATGSDFIICRYDPFVGIFRREAPYTMVIFGSLLLITGIFVNRPYCRYLCPHGVLQRIFSSFSVRHLKISPDECKSCRLCESGCPYDAILRSDAVREDEQVSKPFNGSLPYLLIVPVLAAGLGILMYNLSPVLSGASADVRLAREIKLERDKGIKATSKAATAFLESGKTEDSLYAEEARITGRFRKGAPWVGIFLGLSLGIGLFRFTIRNIRTEYEPDRGRCYSCGKCFKFCPVKAKTQ
jgi:NosR/NirI family transcriptional regulator, nitrous oxide reductase regulator